MHYSLFKMTYSHQLYKRVPFRPPLRLVLSDGIGVTSSIEDRARALSADCTPGPGVVQCNGND